MEIDEINIIENEQSDEINIEDNNSTEEIDVSGEQIIYKYANDYEKLKNLPLINGVELLGNKSLEDLGIENDKNYLHTQTTASEVWQITHNLNKYPSATVIDSAGNEVIGDIEYLDANSLIITFRGAFKGKATLN